MLAIHVVHLFVSGVNSVHAVVDQPELIESAATQPLSYVVAYDAGLYMSESGLMNNFHLVTVLTKDQSL